MTGGYGDGPDIISSCTINVNRGEIVAILGPNGAGKSTAMKAMLGLLNLKSGNISIDGEDISKLSPQERVKKGISFVPQTRNVFAELTVKENLEVGAFLRTDNVNNVIEEIYDLFPILVMDELFEHIIRVKNTKVAIIMVEQNAKQALSISDRGYVLVTGENKFEGSGKELLNDPEVRRSFLGA